LPLKQTRSLLNDFSQ